MGSYFQTTDMQMQYIQQTKWIIALILLGSTIAHAQQPEVFVQLGHSGSVKAVAFSPDGKLALSGSRDGSTRLWNIKTGKEIAQMVSFKDGEWITITPQGYYVASAGGEKHINVRVGNKVSGVEPYRAQFNRPNLVKAALQLESTPPRLVLHKPQTTTQRHWRENPHHSATLPMGSYTFRGQAVDDSAMASVTINNKQISFDENGYFSSQIQIQRGENPIQMTATDIFDNRATTHLTITGKETTPPRIIGITNNIFVENTSTYTLRGQIIDDTDIATLNGQTVRLDKQGHFSYDIPLQI
ncbi:hypothetical protein PN36_03335 [Candidatus Thiomargarita nelsonii]|uniref:Uncharacterized protein n=1 Tax=Candidatus Thiomargarita nelsonii TaxID=1003181 RepID=A0A0A6PA72_9GAMM|nr:hypothetical protein PN36_03335 [Candidatus Thiomargarita nelsonii]